MAGLGWSSDHWMGWDRAAITGWAGIAVGRVLAWWEALGAAKMGWRGCSIPPRDQARGWGQPFTPSCRDANRSNTLRIQQGLRAGSAHTVLGRAGVWGTACLLPVGAVTVPWGQWFGMLERHPPNLLFWGVYSAPTPSPAPGCVVGRQGLEQAEMRRVLGGREDGMRQDIKVPKFLGFLPTTSLPVPHCWGLAAVSPCLSFPMCQRMLHHRRCQLFVCCLVGWGGDGGP